MHALKELQKVEDEIGNKLCQLLGCEEDEHGVEIDLLTVYNSDESQREPLLVSGLERSVVHVHLSSIF
jgi:hypothetical protein